MEQFTDRHGAGIILASCLKKYAQDNTAIVLGLPRGGVPVAYEIAKALSLPLDIFIVRKLGVPGHEELAMGAIASGNTIAFNEEIVRSLNISKSAIEAVIQSEKKELLRREKLYRGNRKFPDLKNKTIILVDDGIATGATVRAAIQGLEQVHPARIVIAVPVASRSTCEEINNEVDELICPLKPIDFYAVGQWYSDFSQTTDAEVADLLMTQ